MAQGVKAFLHRSNDLRSFSRSQEIAINDQLPRAVLLALQYAYAHIHNKSIQIIQLRGNNLRFSLHEALLRESHSNSRTSTLQFPSFLLICALKGKTQSG